MFDVRKKRDEPGHDDHVGDGDNDVDGGDDKNDDDDGENECNDEGDEGSWQDKSWFIADISHHCLSEQKTQFFA